MNTTGSNIATQHDVAMRQIPIERFQFLPRFSTDPAYSMTAHSEECFLDRESGELIWIIEIWDDDLNQESRAKLDADPNRYIEIGFSDHGTHHELLREFLASDWTEDDELRKKAADSYLSSIGEWVEAMEGTGAKYAFEAYKEERFEQWAEEFLAEHGIKPIWID